MKIVDLSISRPVTVSMIIAMLVFLGAISLQRIAIDLFPEIQKPVVRIQTKISGSGPLEVEQLVTLPIEREIATTENLVQMTSKSVEGLSEIRLAFRWNTNLDATIMDLRQKLDIIQVLLPEEAEKPEIERFDPTADPVVILDMSGPMAPEKLRIYAEDTIAPHLDRVSGVAAVQVSGGAEREIRIEIDPDRLTASSLSFSDITELLRRENISQPSGRLEEGRKELLVRTLASLRTAEQIANLVIRRVGAKPVKLKDVALVEETTAERREFARLDGKECVKLRVFKENEANTLKVIDALLKKIESLPLSRGISIKTSYDQSTYIRDSLGMVRTNAYLGAFLAALVLLIFLRNIKSALIVSFSMPVSIVVSFVPLYFSGISLNIFSLAGLALAIGLIVDNSIVILENIFRKMSEGLNARQAALHGTKEVETAVLASTTTTMAVFLPIVFVSGMAGQVFKDLSFSVAYVLGISELVAISLIPLASARIFKGTAPLLAARYQRLMRSKGSKHASDSDVSFSPQLPEMREINFIAQEEHESRFESISDSQSMRIQSFYTEVLNLFISSLPRRFFFVLSMTVLFFATILWLPSLELFPRGTQKEFRMRIQAPAGIALEEVDKLVLPAEIAFSNADQIQAVSSTITDNEGVIKADLVIIMNQSEQIEGVLEFLHGRIIEFIPAGYTVEIQPISILEDILKEGRDPRTYGDIVYFVEGEQMNLLENVTTQIRNKMASLPTVAETMDTIPARKPEIRIILDRERAADLGIRASQLSDTIQRALSGEVATTILESGRHTDIRIVSKGESIATVDDIARLPLLVDASMGNNTIPISRVALVERAMGPVEIQHFERERVLYATARVAAGHATGEVLEKLTNTDKDGSIDVMDIPAGVRIRLGGAAQTMVESFEQLSFALLVAVVLVYMIMAAQFESLSHPFVVMFSVPLSLIGATIGLHFGNQQLSVTAFIGIIVLVGIAVNDAILLVSTTNMLRMRGIDRWDAIVTAGQQRLRPIFMTTLTTVFAMMPLAWGIGPGAEFYKPLALVVIFGLLFATFLTLVLIPAVYIFVDDFGDIISFSILRIRMSISSFRRTDGQG